VQAGTFLTSAEEIDELVVAQFLGHGQLVRGQVVQAQQQPAAQLLLHRMVPSRWFWRGP
jgi:hypothetical protein